MLQSAWTNLFSVRRQKQKHVAYPAVMSPFYIYLPSEYYANWTRFLQSVSLPPSATAHMTEAAAADYTFSCDGTTLPPTLFFSPFSFSINLFKAGVSQLILSTGFCLSFQLSSSFPSSIFPLLSWHPSLFSCFLNVQSVSLLSNCCPSPSTQFVLPPTV